MNEISWRKNCIGYRCVKGIGKAIAFKFSQEGANVAFTYLSNIEKGIAFENELKALGVQAKGYRSDASNFDSAQDLINELVNNFGGIDIIVNNAGITKDSLLMRMTPESWEQVITVNLGSCFNIVKAALRTMIKQRSASIIIFHL